MKRTLMTRTAVAIGAAALASVATTANAERVITLWSHWADHGTKTAYVETAAKKLEAHLKENPKAKTQVHAIASRIIDAGKLENYGTPKAQEYIQRWAKDRE